jgi:hypothetical protein
MLVTKSGSLLLQSGKNKLKDSNCYLFFLGIHKTYFDQDPKHVCHGIYDYNNICSGYKEKRGQIPHNYDLQFKRRVITNPPR